MRKMTWAEATAYLKEFNRERGYKTKGTAEHTTVIAVFTEDSFDKPYPLESRSYAFTNDNKAFIDGQLGYSIFASAIDGSDPCVRLEQYVEDEGNPGGWKVDYCYIKD